MITQSQISEQLRDVITEILTAGKDVARLVDYLAEEGQTLTSEQKQAYADYITGLKAAPDTQIPADITLRTQDDSYTTPTAKILHSFINSVCLAKAKDPAITDDSEHIQQLAALNHQIQAYIENLIAPFKEQNLTIPLEETSSVYQALATTDTEDNLAFHTKIIHERFLDADYVHQSALAYRAHLRPQQVGKIEQVENLANRFADADRTSATTSDNRPLILEVVKHRQAKLPIGREQFKTILLACIDKALESTVTAEVLRDLYIRHEFGAIPNETASSQEERNVVAAQLEQGLSWEDAWKAQWLAWITNTETDSLPPTPLTTRSVANTNGSRAAILVRNVLSDASNEIGVGITEQLPGTQSTMAGNHNIAVKTWAGKCAFNSLEALFSDMLRDEQGKTMAAPYGETSTFVQRLRAIRSDIAHDRPVYISASGPLDILTKTIQHFDYALEKKQIAESLQDVTSVARDNIDFGLERAQTPAQFQDYKESLNYKENKAQLENPLKNSIATALQNREAEANELIAGINNNFEIFGTGDSCPNLNTVLTRYLKFDDPLKIQLYKICPTLAQILGELHEIYELQTLAENIADVPTIRALQHRLDIIPYKHQIIAHCYDYEQKLHRSAGKILRPNEPFSPEANTAVDVELKLYQDNPEAYRPTNTKLQITIEKLYAIDTMKQAVQAVTTREQLTAISTTHLDQNVFLQHRDGKTQLFALKVLAVITSLGKILGENKQQRQGYFNFDEEKLVQDKITPSGKSIFVPSSVEKTKEIDAMIKKIPRSLTSVAQDQGSAPQGPGSRRNSR